MYWLGPTLAVAGLGLLLYGFNKNKRGVLATAGIILFLAGALPDFIEGYIEGASSVAVSAPTSLHRPYA